MNPTVIENDNYQVRTLGTFHISQTATEFHHLCNLTTTSRPEFRERTTSKALTTGLNAFEETV